MEGASHPIEITLEGASHPIEVHTDHRNLEYLQLNQQQVRWALFFSRFNFRVTYIPRSHYRQADALSRKPEYDYPKMEELLSTVLRPENFAVALRAPTMLTQLREQQDQDPFVQVQLQQPAGSEMTGPSPFPVHDGFLCHCNWIYGPPGPVQMGILQKCHDSLPAGHFRLYKTLHLVT